MKDRYLLADIADRLQVPRSTVDGWRHRMILPPEDGWNRGSPFWLLATVRDFHKRWLESDGRPGRWESQ